MLRDSVFVSIFDLESELELELGLQVESLFAQISALPAVINP